MGKGHNIVMIGAALGWGAQLPETELGPQSLKDTGLCDFLKRQGLTIAWLDIVKAKKSALGKTSDFEKNLPQVIDFNNQLCHAVNSAAKDGFFPIVIGGDHACAIGTWPGVTQALKCQKSFGLIWIDAHMDSHTPTTSDSMAIHGMPVAHILGHGNQDLCDVGFKGASISPEHLVLIGIRSYEPLEKQFLEKMGVKVYYIEEVKARGFEKVFEEALAIVNNQTKGFGISIDLDGFDCEQAPGVGSPEPNGLDKAQVIPCFNSIAYHPQLKALEIAEYNPQRDKGNLTEDLIKDILVSAFNETGHFFLNKGCSHEQKSKTNA